MIHGVCKRFWLNILQSKRGTHCSSDKIISHTLSKWKPFIVLGWKFSCKMGEHYKKRKKKLSLLKFIILIWKQQCAFLQQKGARQCLSISPRCCLSPQGTELVRSCWKVSTPLKLTAFVPRRFSKIILLPHSCDQLILPHFECFSLKLGLQTSVMQRRIWQGDSKFPPLWKGTFVFVLTQADGFYLIPFKR